MSQARYDVVGIGNAIVDVLSSADDALIERAGLARGTMSLIDEDRAGEIYGLMGPGTTVSGGSCANTIAGLAKLGARTAFIGKVREDELGAAFGHDIRSIGVAFDTPAATDGPGSGRCLILVTPDGERTMGTHLGAAVDLGPDDVDPAMVADSAILYLEGYLWDPPQAKDAFRKAMQVARQAGRKVALTLSDPFCVDRHREEFRSLMEGEVDILFANELEIVSLYQAGSFDEAVEAVAGHCELAALSRSERGCVIVGGGQAHAVPAEPVEQVVDTTGAGDLFAAGVLLGLVRGMDLPTCGRVGNICAADVIGRFGARSETDLAALVASRLG